MVGKGYPNTQKNQSDISEHESGYEENPWQAPMHKGRTQGTEAAGFDLEFELQICWSPFQPELSTNLTHSPGKKSSPTKPKPRAKQCGKWRQPFIHSSGFVCPRSVVLHLGRNSPTHQHGLRAGVFQPRKVSGVFSPCILVPEGKP